jgi:hypothetical protein
MERSLPGLRRGPPERLAAWLYTGPLGHFYGVVADIAELWTRYAAGRMRARLRALLPGRL